jgi:hypothetical protein
MKTDAQVRTSILFGIIGNGTWTLNVSDVQLYGFSAQDGNIDLSNPTGKASAIRSRPAGQESNADVETFTIGSENRTEISLKFDIKPFAICVLVLPITSDTNETVVYHLLYAQDGVAQGLKRDFISSPYI